MILIIKNFVDFADFVNNFKIVINKLKLFFKRRWHIYNQVFEKSKVCLFDKFRGLSIFRDVIVFVTFFVIFQIFEQYKRLCCEFTIISTCINNFNKIMKLSCAHKIQKRWYNRVSDKVFKFKNFHFHWRYIKFTEQKSDEKNIKVFETLSTIERFIALENILRV